MGSYDKYTDKELVAMARDEKNAGKDMAMNEIFDRYDQKVKNISGAFFIRGGDKDDVIQEAMIGLFKAILNYDLESETPFENYATVCIRNNILSAVSSADTKTNEPLNEAASSDDEKTARAVESGSFGPSAENEVMEKEMWKAVLDWLSNKADGNLTKLEKRVIELKMEGKNYREIAVILGKEPKAIDNALQRAKRKIKDLIN